MSISDQTLIKKSLRENQQFGFPTRSDTNQPVQSQTQEQATSLKCWIYEEDGLYYQCREHKGADQLRGSVFAYANCWFSGAAAYLSNKYPFSLPRKCISL